MNRSGGSNRSFRQNKEAAERLMEWWTGLQKRRGDKAELKRCANLREVLLLPSYYGLYSKLAALGFSSKEGVAAVAGLAAHIEEFGPATGGGFATQMATPAKGRTSPRISGLRFRRLLKFENREELFPALARVVRQLGRKADLLSLADGVYWWTDKTKADWAFEYYSKAPKSEP